MTRGISNKICCILLSALALLACLHSPAFAETEEDLQTLEMFYEGKDLVVSATRNPKPISQAAENITIVSAAEIEALGAHTLVDVLASVPGIQTADRGGPGFFAEFIIQGADVYHILVMLDGVTLNSSANQFIDIAAIPLQNIERLEIVKGPGSSSWGSALGGVINIVTKSPLEDKKLGGALSFTAGERQTRDARGEISGTLGRFGYYLYAGNLTSDGFRPNTAADHNNLYAKLCWKLPERGNLQFSIAYDRGTVGDGDSSSSNFFSRFSYRYLLSTLALNYPVTDKIALDFSLRTTSKRTVDFGNFLGDDPANGITAGDPLSDIKSRESSDGGSAKLTWREGINSLAVGADFDHLNIDSDPNLTGGVKLFSDKYGVFLNDTFTIGAVAITPGIRYDRMRPVGDFFSPSLGAAWSLNDKTILRAYSARGYSLPVLSADSTQQKVITVQAGGETTLVPHLWIKTTLFLNYLSDVSTYDYIAGTYVNTKQKKQGVEVEAKTTPFFNTALSAGYTFLDAKDRETGETLPNIPRQLVKLGLHYNDQHSLRGALIGRYVWWTNTSHNNPKGNAGIWDFNLAKKLFTANDLSLELFFNVHNLFNSAQYADESFRNARRWLEGGIRCTF
jgi:vitamin B12 transporter